MDRNRTTRRNEFLPLAKFKTYKLKNYNFRLILLLLVICGLGIAIIGSANDGSDNRAVFKQAIGMVIGFSGMIVISLIDYGWILKFYWLIYVFNVGLLSAVLLIGSSHHGAKRWIDITDGLTIQPSEFAKIFTILFLAKFLTINKERISKWWFLIVTAGLAGITLLLIEKEPDLSTTILVTGLTIIMVFAAGISYKKIGIILAVFIPVAAAAIIYIQQPEQKLLDDYQMNRINAFLFCDMIQYFFHNFFSFLCGTNVFFVVFNMLNSLFPQKSTALQQCTISARPAARINTKTSRERFFQPFV